MYTATPDGRHSLRNQIRVEFSALRVRSGIPAQSLHRLYDWIFLRRLRSGCDATCGFVFVRSVIFLSHCGIVDLPLCESGFTACDFACVRFRISMSGHAFDHGIHVRDLITVYI